MYSVIIPTCNRSLALAQTFTHLGRCAAPAGRQWEIVVVDNRSTDDTKKIIEEFAATAPVPVKYVWEPRQGCCHARNTGFVQSVGDIVVFLDDDCHPPENWLQTIADKFDADPALGFLGGRVELADPTDLPISIRRVYRSAEFTNPSDHINFIASCNMAVRRAEMARLGGFDPRFGPGSRRKLVADDFEFVYRAFKQGSKIVYFPDVVVYHAHGRKTQEAFLSVMKGYSRGWGALWAKHALLGDVQALRLGYWRVRALLRERAEDRRSGKGSRDELNALAEFLLGAFWIAERMIREKGEPRFQ